MLIRSCEIGGAAPLDVRIARGRVAAIGAGLSRARGEPLLDARGGALLPGLHDHHLHLFALAAAESSVHCGPPRVHDAEALRRALAAHVPVQGWIRGVGYHESVAGELDRARLDALAPPHPVRVQHRSGACWMLCSRALEALGLDAGTDAHGVERDAAGRATGRLFGLDVWLRAQLPEPDAPGLPRVGRRLARCGVTGVTDATPSNGADEMARFAEARAAGALPQRVLAMGGAALPASCDGVARGAFKIRLEERELPDPDALAGTIARAHAEGRPVAIHCVTRVELVFAASALRAAGARRGDRIEHASVTTPEGMAMLAALPVTVVTQPGFVRERGDAYLRDVDPRDRPWLYRGRGFRDAGLPLAAGSDAPFGDADPWRAVRAAVERRSEAGALLGGAERLTPEEALALFTSPASAPGAAPRRVAAGAPADLCLLDRPWRAAREQLSSELVAATLCAGRLVWHRA